MVNKFKHSFGSRKLEDQTKTMRQKSDESAPVTSDHQSGALVGLMQTLATEFSREGLLDQLSCGNKIG
jgi:hypothetical protein